MLKANGRQVWGRKLWAWGPGGSFLAQKGMGED